MPKIIVVGANGDLGSQLVKIMLAAGNEVLERDLNTPLTRSDIADDAIIHLCIPASALASFAWLGDMQHCKLVLHDSVMANSLTANRQYFNNQANVVHMLMNQSRTVVIDKASPEASYLKDYFDTLGLKPAQMSADEHDGVMASSQAPLALLVHTTHQPLKDYKNRGLLTPSGEELERALDSRAASWTPATIESLLRNPKLAELVDSMKATLDELRYNNNNDKTSDSNRPAGE